LLLNLVRLEPGQALFLDAGNLHAYLQGAGIEVMANSDNVLRGGLTTKHVDVPELLRIVDFTARPIEPIVPEDSAGEKIYRTPAREFQLSRIELAASAHEIAAHPGAEILLCTAGEVDVAERGGAALAMPRGTSVFVAARSGSVRIAGSGTIFRTTIQPDTTH
jgi:mannose-6-phosphate isomerase